MPRITYPVAVPAPSPTRNSIPRYGASGGWPLQGMWWGMAVLATSAPPALVRPGAPAAGEDPGLDQGWFEISLRTHDHVPDVSVLLVLHQGRAQQAGARLFRGHAVQRGPRRANGATATLSLYDRDQWDSDGRLGATMYFQNVDNPDVWLTAEQSAIIGEEQSPQADATVTLRFPEYAKTGQYRTWILVTDGFAGRHHVWYGPAGQTPPTHAAGVPTTARVVTYNPAALFTHGAILTVT